MQTDQPAAPTEPAADPPRWPVNVRVFLNRHDAILLDESQAFEHLNKSEVLRRALRHYHRYLKQQHAERNAA